MNRVKDIWVTTKPAIQDKKIVEVMKLVQEDTNARAVIWSYAAPDIQKANSEIFSRIIKSVLAQKDLNVVTVISEFNSFI